MKYSKLFFTGGSYLDYAEDTVDICFYKFLFWHNFEFTEKL